MPRRPVPVVRHELGVHYRVARLSVVELSLAVHRLNVLSIAVSRQRTRTSVMAEALVRRSS